MIEPTEMEAALLSIALITRVANEAMDALELMVQQYMHWEPTGPQGEGAGFYSHDFMSVGEYLSEWLPRWRPERWSSNGLGLVPLFRTPDVHEAEHHTTIEEFHEGEGPEPRQ